MLLDVAHTRVHAGGFLLYRNGKQEGEEPEYYPDFERVLDVDMSALSPEAMIEQEAIVREDLIEGLEIETRLGAGGYGTAYKAVLKHGQRAPKPLVVKIANAMLQHGIIREVFDVDTKKTKLRYNATIAKKCFDQIHKAREDLKKEYEYALQILAPRYYQLRYADEFYRVTPRSAQDFIAIQEEAKILRRHPGYNHLHKILHFNFELACVLSETCINSLINFMYGMTARYATRKRKAEDGLPDDQRCACVWYVKLNRDIGLAIQYLLSIARISHMDIKPDNIFYKQGHNSRDPTDDANFVWVLADYGLCDKISRDNMLKHRPAPGTRSYFPRHFAERKPKGDVAYRSDLIMLHCYAISMFEAAMYLYPHEIKINPFEFIGPQFTKNATNPVIVEWGRFYPHVQDMLREAPQVDFMMYSNIQSTPFDRSFHFHVDFCNQMVIDCERELSAINSS